MDSNWIPWNGGESAPVFGTVEYRLRDGYTHTAGANTLDWTHEEDEGDIVSYRTVDSSATPK